MGCDCGALLVKNMKVGGNTITLSPSGVGDVIRWSATKASVAAGDIGMSTTTGRPSAFIGGAARDISEDATNLNTAPGYGIYGSGSDGSPSSPLVANTTLASGDRCVRFTNLDLAGFILTPNTADRSCVLTISGTLTMGGGTIAAAAGSTAGGAGGAGGGTAGAGGAGGSGRWNVYVYARAISGSGTFTATGGSGANGVAGTAPASNTAGSGGTSATNSNVQFNIQTQASSTVGGAGAAIGGAGGAARTAQTVGARSAATAKDLLRYWYFSGPQTNSTGDNQRVWESSNGGGGGGGSARNVSPSGGGGSGAVGSRFIGVGGASGAGATGIAGTGAGGGGGGAGGPGSLIMVVCETSSASLTISANGGTSGNGGSASSATAGAGSGSGGASGGSALYIGPVGGSATVAATGSAAGASGGTGVAAGTGSSGGNGVAMSMTRET